MEFKEERKNVYLDPFKRVKVDVKTSLNGFTVSAEAIGNRIRITVPKDEGGNLTGTIVENMALENSTWIFDPIYDEIDERVDKIIHPRKHMDLSKFDLEKGILPMEKFEILEFPVHYRKDYSPFARTVLEHPNEKIRKIALGYIDDEDVMAAIVLFSKDKDVALFVLDNIKDMEILSDIVKNDFNYYYFTAAVDIFYDLSKGKLPLRLFDADIRKAALDRIEDKDALLAIDLDLDGWSRPAKIIKDNGLMSKKELEDLDLLAQNNELRKIIKNRLK